MGLALRRWIPETHLGADTKDIIRLVTGITATMSGLVLGMLVSSAKNYYDSWNTQVAEIAAQVVSIDHLLASYGPETGQIRILLRNSVERGVERIWPDRDPLDVAFKPQEQGEILMTQLENLTPVDAAQTSLKNQIMPMTASLRQAQWRMFLRTKQTSMPVPLLIIVISWQAMIFMSLGLFAPPNTTIRVTLALGALTVSTAVFIILEMYFPFKGLLVISSAPITDAIKQMGH